MATEELEEISLEEAAKIDAKAPQVVSLISYLRDIWRVNREHKEKQGVTEQMLSNLRARNSEYDPAVLAKIKAAGFPDVFAGITGVKCRAAEAWVLDIYGSRQNTWSLIPTPDPDYSGAVKSSVAEEITRFVQQGEFSGEDVQREVEKESERLFDKELNVRTKNMETKIRDQFTEGGFPAAFRDVVSDIITFKAGVLKGPITRSRKVKRWVTNPDTDENVEETIVKLMPEYERVSPLDLYPSPNATNPDEGSMVEKIKIPRHELVALKKEPGYYADAIDRVLTQFSAMRGQVEETEERSQDRETQERRDFEDGDQFAEDLDGLEFHVRAQGKMLKESGVTKMPDGSALEDLEEYDVNAILIGSELVYTQFNDDPTGSRPYHVVGWEKECGSFWYKGVPELMADLQRMCNGATRALANNMAIASGPQVVVDTDQLMPGENLSTLTPLKIWQTRSKNAGGNRKAIEFEQPSSNANELMAIYDRYAQLADDYTQIPAYSYGTPQASGAGRTFGGLSALMSNSARGIKRVLSDIHTDMLARVIRRQFDWNMRYLDNDYKGDVEIVPVGIVALMVREQLAEKRIQFVQSIANDLGMEVLDFKAKAKILRETAEALEITDIIPDDEELEELQEKQEAQQGQQQQLEQQAFQLDAQKQMMELQKMQAEAQLTAVQAQVAQLKSQLSVAEEQRRAAESQANMQLKARKTEAEAIKDEATANKINVEAAVSASQSVLDAHERSQSTNDTGTKRDKPGA